MARRSKAAWLYPINRFDCDFSFSNISCSVFKFFLKNLLILFDNYFFL